MTGIEILKYLGIGGAGIVGGIGATLFWCFKYFVPRIVEKKKEHEILERTRKGLLLEKEARSLGWSVANILHQAGLDIPKDGTQEELREALQRESNVRRGLLFLLLDQSLDYAEIVGIMAGECGGEKYTGLSETLKRAFCGLWERMAEKEENEGWIKEVVGSVGMAPEEEEATFAQLKASYLYFKNPSEGTFSEVMEAVKRLSDARENQT